ncbi:hypothetical protein Dimus_016847 [Dionaea muscipula]
MATTNQDHYDHETFSEKRRKRMLDAAYNGDLPLLQKLVEEFQKDEEEIGKNVEGVANLSRQNALHLAAWRGKTKCCKYLVENLGFDVHARATTGDTPLHFAAWFGEYSTVLYLLNRHAHPRNPNNQGLTALHIAAETGRKGLLGLLIARDAEVDAQSEVGTPLQVASFSGKKESVKILLQNKANPNMISHYIYTPLMSAIIASSLDCVQLLLKGGADPKLNSFGYSALACASMKGPEFTNCLLKAGADPNTVDILGKTPLEAAAFHNNHLVVKILFPVTSPIKHIPDWSVDGLMKHVHSPEVLIQDNIAFVHRIMEAKAGSQKALEAEDYLEAVNWYTMGMVLEPYDSRWLNHRSVVWAKQSDGHRALWDANAGLRINPNSAELHYRAGVAHKLLEDYDYAKVEFLVAYHYDPENEEIQAALREVEALSASTSTS